MTVDILEIIIKKALKIAVRECSFAFQGGEPTLAGLDFYKTLVRLVKENNVNTVQVHYSLQTNGILIDESWAAFLSENNFLIGISLDGPKDIHDMNRQDSKNEGTFSKVMEAISVFERHSVNYNILSVISSAVARHPERVYDFFKKKGFKYLQFIPCIDPFGELAGNCKFSLTPQKYTHFLKKLFDLWYEDMNEGNGVSIRYFDDLLGIYMGYVPESCGMMGVCQCQFVVEANGGVYSCDFYATDEWLLGNLKDMDLEDISRSEKNLEFIAISKHVDSKCKECRWFNLCRGECRRFREPYVNGKPALNFYCSSFEIFFEYAVPRLKRLAAIISRDKRI